MASSRPVIEVHNLVAQYGERTILQDVSFTVYEGEIFVILGGSGCGKSTLLKHLIGLLRPASGRILVEGEDIAKADDRTLQRVLRKAGILFQGGALLGSMTLGENIALPIEEYLKIHGERRDMLVRMKLHLVNLEGYENHLPSEISGGMKKRAAMARAMALNPKILYFDEPSAGLDPVTAAEIDNLIVHINRSLGTTMVIVTHDLESIFAVAHRVIMLDGRAKGIIAEGDPKVLKAHTRNPFVWEFFNRRPEGSAPLRSAGGV